MKEDVLGVEVFDRTASFDPRVDTIVRGEAVKLRKRIQEYYRGPKRKDPVIIELPKGAYVPQFRLRASRIQSGSLSRDQGKAAFCRCAAVRESQPRSGARVLE